MQAKKNNISFPLFILLIFSSLSVSVYADDLDLPCGTFSNVLQTRHDPSKIEMKSGATAHIYDSPDCNLNTGSIVQDDNSNQRLICDKSGEDAQATGNYGKALNESAIFTWNFEDSQASESVGGGSSHTVESNNENLTDDKYNVIKQNWKYKSFTWSPSGSDIGVNKFDNILNTVTVDNVSNKDVKIGKFITKNYSNTNLNFSQTPNKIEIGKLSVSGSNRFDANWEAKTSIDITEMDITSSSTNDITLKAPTVRVAKENSNKMDLSNNDNHIVIYADKLYIGEVDFGQRNTLEIHPYTPGQKVEVYIRQVDFSSNSQIIMDSGNYHIRDTDVPGSGQDIALLKASDENQIINLIIDPSSSNHDFEIGNNFGINSDGTDGDFGNNNPANFRIFVNGDVETGGGGTTFNALVYATGEVNLGSPTYVRGAISSKKDITISNDSKFYWDNRIDDAGLGSCGIRLPSYQNQYSCGIFDSVLTSYDSITSNGNHDQACYTANISYPEGKLTGDIQCNPSGCGGGQSCQRVDPPKNRMDYNILDTTVTGSSTAATKLTDLYYGDLSYGNNKTISFEPSQTYSDDLTPVMILGDVTVQKDTLKFQPGDYYFNSLTFDSNNNKLELPNGGPVRIFVKNDLSVAMNNLSFNTSGSQNNLFVYVGGDFNSIGNGGGTTALKAFIYVKGSVTLNNNSNNWKIYGAITAEGSVTINGNNPDFIQQGSAEDLGYGSCHMCYSDIKVGGASFGMGSCPGFSISMFQKIEVPILTSDELSNVSVEEAHKKSIFSFSAFNTNQVRNQDGNKVRDAQNSSSGLSAGAMGIDASLFSDKVITYPLGDNNGDYGPTSTENYQELYTYALFGFDMCKWEESLAYVAHYEDEDGRHYDIEISQCEETPPQFHSYTTGPFDAWDTDRDNTQSDTEAPTDRNISTKIINESFNLSLASFAEDLKTYEKKDGIGTIKVAIYNNSNPSSQISTDSFDFNSSDNPHLHEVPFTVNRASRDAFVGFRLCASYNDPDPADNDDTKVYTLYPAASCTQPADIKECDFESSTPVYRVCASTDHFAVRPYAFGKFGENQYKRAGEDFNLNIKAVDKTEYDKIGNSASSGNTESVVSGAAGYDANLTDLDFTSNYYVPTAAQRTQMQNDTGKTDVATCPDAGAFTLINANDAFLNGEVNTSLKFSETGILDITLSEKPGQEWAVIDTDDTNSSQRFIKSSTQSYDKNNIKNKILLMFVPYQFDTSAQYNSSTNTNWLYMHDINKSNTTFTTPVMSAFVKYTITAKNKDGNTVKNYTKTCFPDTDEANAPRVNGLKLNTTFDLFLDMDLNSSRSTLINLYSEDNASNALWTLQTDKTLIKGKNQVQEWISPFQFENGKGEAKVYFNINRKINTAQNPTRITVVDANTSTSWMSNSGSPKSFNGVTLNTYKDYYYGRTHSPRQRFVGSAGDAFIYYEVYCDTANDGNKSLLQDGVNAKFIDDPRWFINTQHQTPRDGQINSVTQKGATKVTATNITTDNPSKVHLKYNSDKNYPYKATMQINNSDWLIYNKYNPNATVNEFDVEFISPSGNWAGEAETNTTTKRNAAKQTNRRLMW